MRFMKPMIALLIVITVMLNMTCFAGWEPEPLADLNDPFIKGLYDIAIENTKQYGELLTGFHSNDLFGDVVDYADTFEKTAYGKPESVMFYFPNEILDTNAVIAAKTKTDISFDSEALTQLKTSLCFSLFKRMNLNDSFADGLFLDIPSTYAVHNITEFHDFAYVILWYSWEEPVIVTAFCDAGKGNVISKTGMMYDQDNLEDAFYSAISMIFDIWGINDEEWNPEIMNAFIYDFEYE